jgi:ER degradation enhancer, mannosidase alpha-like 1
MLIRGLNDVLGNFSLTLVDSMDTLALMGLQSEFEHSVRMVIENVHFNVDSRVQVFEVTIRMLGGLLSAHSFAIDEKLGYKIEWYKQELLDLAIDLGDRLLPAFNTTFGLPFPRVHLQHGVLPNEVKEACTAGAGTLILEFGVLSRLSGNPIYETVAKKALLEIWSRRSALDLVGNTMNLFDKEVRLLVTSGSNNTLELALVWILFMNIF